MIIVSIVISLTTYAQFDNLKKCMTVARAIDRTLFVHMCELVFSKFC